MALNNKKGNWPIAIAIIVAVLILVGGVGYMNGGGSKTLSLSDKNEDSNNLESDVNVYLQDISSYNSSLFEVTKSGSAENKEFDIQIDKDNLGNSARKESMILEFKQRLPEGVTISSDSIQAHTLTMAPDSDISLENTTGSNILVYDYDDSTIGGNEGSVQETFTATDVVKVNVTMSFNPQSQDLTTIKEWDEVGEDYSVGSLDFGQSNSVSLEINN